MAGMVLNGLIPHVVFDTLFHLGWGWGRGMSQLWQFAFAPSGVSSLSGLAGTFHWQS